MTVSRLTRISLYVTVIGTLSTGALWGATQFAGYIATAAELKREEVLRVANDQAEAVARVKQVQTEQSQRVAQDLRLQIKIDVNSVRDDIARGESELAAITARAERGEVATGDARRRQVLEQNLALLVERLHDLRVDQESIQ